MMVSSPQAGPPQQQTMAVELIPVLSDNYVMLLSRGHEAAVVDPAVDGPVRQRLEERGLELVTILQTHHHSDHIGSTPALLRRWPACAVVAARDDRERIPFQTMGVADGDQLTVLGEPVKVLAVPGHTRAHLAYWFPRAGHLFCGDTLFAGGCGRLFEGSAAQMQASLQRLAALPDSTWVWCAHEYTEANLRWAAATVSAADPAAGPIRQRLAAVLEQRARGQATVPSQIGLELATNLFLRAADAPSLARLRDHKDHWRS